MTDWLLTASPILVLLLAAIAELLQSLWTRRLATISATELARQRPDLHWPAQFLRHWPRICLVLGGLVVIARVNRMLSITDTVGLILGLVLLWLLLSIVIELWFGLTYRMVRRASLPGEPAIGRDQFRLGQTVRQVGWYRALLWLVALGLVVAWRYAS